MNCLKNIKDNKDRNIENKSSKNIQQILLDNYNNKYLVYLIRISYNLYKFGYTDNINRRFSEHQVQIGSDIELVHCIESKNNKLLENKLKEYLKVAYNIKTQLINTKLHIKLFETDDILPIQMELINLNEDITVQL